LNRGPDRPDRRRAAGADRAAASSCVAAPDAHRRRRVPRVAAGVPTAVVAVPHLPLHAQPRRTAQLSTSRHRARLVAAVFPIAPTRRLPGSTRASSGRLGAALLAGSSGQPPLQPPAGDVERARRRREVARHLRATRGRRPRLQRVRRPSSASAAPGRSARHATARPRASRAVPCSAPASRFTSHRSGSTRRRPPGAGVPAHTCSSSTRAGGPTRSEPLPVARTNCNTATRGSRRRAPTHVHRVERPAVPFFFFFFFLAARAVRRPQLEPASARAGPKTSLRIRGSASQRPPR
jgi:hypothetical protein